MARKLYDCTKCPGYCCSYPVIEVKDVTIKFGTSLADARPLTKPFSYEADDKVTGCLPPGHGTVSVWASDPITGDDQLAGAFTYTDGPLDPTSVWLCDSSTSPASTPP